jgi:hypothetical protein
MVALTAVLRKPASTAKRKMYRTRSSAFRPPANRFTRTAPSTASSVLPSAMASDVATEPAVLILMRKAPTKITGQRPTPLIRKAASAMPAGGQTGVALACR